MPISDSSSSELVFSSSSESVSSMILSTEALGFEAIVVAKTRRVAVIKLARLHVPERVSNSEVESINSPRLEY